MSTLLSYFMLLLLSFLSFLLIVIVLLQRGRGGGLAGALGGAGGQSAFGTKAGDMFTKITVGLALVWVLVAGLSINVLSWSQSTYTGGSEVGTNLENPAAANQDAPAADLGTESTSPGLVPEIPTTDGAMPAQTPAATPESTPAAPEKTDGAAPAEAEKKPEAAAPATEAAPAAAAPESKPAAEAPAAAPATETPAAAPATGN